MSKLDYYELSEKADKNLDEIFDCIEIQHSFINQAVKYLTDLENVFESLVLNSLTGRTRNEIKQELLSITEQKHTVFTKS